MKNILKVFRIKPLTYIYFILCFITGYIKEPLIILIVVIVHEMGHVFVSSIYGYKINKIEIFPFGGITTANKPINSDPLEDLFIYSAGFIFQILFIIILYIVRINSFDKIIYYSFVIIAFNLLAIYPLDGFYIIKSLLDKKIAFYYSYLIMGFISVISLIVFNIFYFKESNYLIISFLIFKIIDYFKVHKVTFNKFLLERYLYNLTYSKIKYLNIFSLKKIKRNCYHYFKINNRVYSEKDILAKKFDINKTFW